MLTALGEQNMTFDMYQEVLAGESVPIAVRTTAAQGSGSTGWVDLRGFEGAAIFIHAGAITDGTFTTKIQESDDAATPTDVAAGDLQGTAPAIASANDSQIFTLGYKGSKRYIRVFDTVTGSPSTGGAWGAMVVKGRPQQTPVR